MTAGGGMLVHASCVAIDGAGVLIRGPSGAGKSDLALRVIAAGGRLVADDQVALASEGGALVGRAPKALAGRLEVRGLGIVDVPSRGSARLCLLVDLVDPAAVERLPDARFEVLCGVSLPRIALAPFEASAPAKLRLAAARAKRDRVVRP